MAVALTIPYAHNDLFAPASTGIDFPWPLCAKTTYERPRPVSKIPTIQDHDRKKMRFFGGFCGTWASGPISVGQASVAYFKSNELELRAVPESTASTRTVEESEMPSSFKLEIAYHALADRRGANATPAGRAASRKIWRDAGTKAVEWLIDKFKKEQHPETIIGIAETITALEDIALPVVLSELEGDEPKPEYAALIEALAWMKPPQHPHSLTRIVSIINRYFASPHLDCQVAAVQLTRILDDDQARQFLDRAKKSAKQRLHEEIEDLLNERFEE